MLEGVFSSILNSFLSAYVENLNTKQLNVGIWGGDIRLKNLKLKKGALDALHLPVDVVGGSIGSLVLQIPWTQLSSRPVKAYIDDVYLLATMSQENKSSPQEDAKRAHDVKMEKVKRNEIYAMRKAAGDAGEDEQKQQGYIQALTEKIIDNVQIVVKNVHLRYEDNISVPGHPFAAGFTFAEISLVSTDENWREAFVSGRKSGAHKLAKLDSLALYFDTDSTSLTGLGPDEFHKAFTDLIARENHLPKHQYILKPVTGEGKTIIRPVPTAERAKIDLQLSFRELGFVLDSNQFRDTVSTAHQLEYNSRQRDYASHRPPAAEFEANRYRALWKFATTAVRHEIHEKEYRWTWESMARRREDRKQYIGTFKLEKQNLCPAADKPKMDEIERRYSASDIILWRWIARNELKAEQKTAEEQHPQPQGGGGWFGGWWGGGKGKHDQETDTLDSDEIADRFGVRGEEVTADIDLPDDVVKLCVNAKLETGSLALRSGEEGTDIIRMVFDAFSADLLQRKENFEVAMGLGGMRVYDATVPGTQYPQVVRIKEEPTSDGPARSWSLGIAKEGDTIDQVRSEIDPDHPFFYVKFESKPLDKRADSAVTVRMRPMEIVYHRGYIEKIVWFFRPQDDDKLETVGAMMDVAGGALAENFRQTTRIGLEWALEQHSSIDVRADLNAPVIVIPEDVTRRDSQHLLLDAGHIAVTSDLIPQEERVKTKDKRQLTDDDLHYLESIMYDRMRVDFKDAQLIMGNTLDECLAALTDESPKGDLHLLERISMHFDVSRCIVPMAPNLTQLKIAGDLPELHVNFSDRKYRTIMRMKDVAIPNFDPPATATATATSATSSAGEAVHAEANGHAEVEGKGQRPSRTGRPSMRRKSVFSRPSGLFTDNRASEYAIDSSSDEEEDRKDGEEDEFFEAPDMAESSGRYRRKDLEFSFTVGKLMASVYKSRSTDDGEDRHLVDPTLEGFVFSFDKRQYDMTVNIGLRTLYLDDRMVEKGTKFSKLITSEPIDEKEVATTELVKFKYVQVEKESPEFMTVHEGVAQTVELELSTINVFVTRPSILELYDWIMSTFAGGDEVEAASPDSPSEEFAPTPATPTDEAPQKLRVKARLNGIALVLHEEKAKIATLVLSAADVSILLNGPTMRISARLGNLAFDDDSNASTTSHFRNLLRIEGNELADFQYETFDRREPTYPGHDYKVWLRSGSLHFTVVEDTLHRLLVFVNQFAKMKSVMDRASEAAKQASKQASEATQTSKLHVDILVNSPVITFPRGGETADCLRAYLGEISLRNEFSGDDQHLVTKYIAGLHKVSLTSDFHRDGKKHTLQVLRNVNVDVAATNFANLDRGDNRVTPDNDIEAHVTDVKLSLTQAQYQMIMTLGTTIPRIFDMTDVAEHVDAVVPDPPKPAPPPKAGDKDQSPGQIVDLLPELPGAAHTPDGKEVPLWSATELQLKVTNIVLDLYDGNEVEESALAECLLATTTVHKTQVNYKSMSDGSAAAELSLQSLKAKDMRGKIARDVFSSGLAKGEQQLLLSFTQSGFDGSKMINADIDTPRVTLSPDYLIALGRFFSSPPATADELSRDDPHQAENEAKPAPSPADGPSLSYRFNIVKPRLTVLADHSRKDSDEVQIKVDRIIITQQRTMSIAIARLGASLRASNTDLVQFLDDIDFQFSLDQHTDQGRELTAIEAHLTPLVARVSLRDIMALRSIYQTAMNGLTPPGGESQPAEEEPIPVPRRTLDDEVDETGQIHVSTQSANATIDKIQLIFISDLHELPVIDISTRSFTIEAKDWSSDMSVETTISPFINYYNLTNSHWEPLMDPWSFQFLMQRSVTPACLSVQLSSRQRLDLNVTANLVEMALTAYSIWSREGQKILHQNRGGTKPYTIRNRTGYGLLIWAHYEDSSRGDAHELADGKDTPWRFEDWRATRQNVLTSSHDKLGVAIQGTAWQELPGLSVIREGQHVYSLRPKIDGVTHRLLCKVELHGNIKVVTLRSTFSILNDTALPVEMVIIDGHGKTIGEIHHIAPGEACPVPIQAAYSERIKIRPNVGFGYGWCKASFHWKDLVKQPVRTIVCPPIQGNGAPHRFVAATVYDKDDPVVRHYPKLTLRLRAPIEVENLLPFDVKFRVYLKERERTYSAFLRKGGVSPLHIVDPLDLLLLGIEIEEEGVIGFKRSDYAIISTDSPEDLPLEYMLPIQDDDGLTLNLRLHYVRYPMSGGAFKVQVYCPYVIINKTGLDFGLQSRTSIGFTKAAAGLNLYSDSSRRREPVPFLFAHPTNDTGNRALLRVGDSQWCKQPINFDVVGADRQVTMLSPTRTSEITAAIGISEGLGAYELTKVVTIYPHFVLSNKSRETLWIREAGSDDAIRIDADHKTPLSWLRDSKDPQVVIALDASYDKRWSKPFRISSVGKLYIRIATEGDDRVVLVEVLLQNQSLFIRFMTEPGYWPFIVRNNSTARLYFGQPTKRDEGDRRRRSPRNDASSMYRAYPCPPGGRFNYAWDDPSVSPNAIRFLLDEPDPPHHDVDILAIGTSNPLTSSTNAARKVVFDVVAEGPTQVVVVTDHRPKPTSMQSKYERRGGHGGGAPLKRESTADTVDYLGVEEPKALDDTFVASISLEGIGISVVDQKLRELVYGTLRGIDITMNDNPARTSYGVIVRWIQIDNQLESAPAFPTLLRPDLEYDPELLELRPNFQAELVPLKDTKHGVQYFEYASTLLQAMYVELDESFIYALVNFAKVAEALGQGESLSCLTSEPAETPEPVSEDSGSDLYFDVFELQPVVFIISFERTDDRETPDRLFDSRNPASFIANAVTMALGTISGARVEFKSIGLWATRTTSGALVNRVLTAYRAELVPQLYRLVGSADFLGNPVGLFNNVASGVSDLFYEPINGVVAHGGSELGYGIARGAGAFLKKSAFGVTDSVSKLTGTVGKGISAATLDPAWAAKRQQRQMRNRYKINGFATGASAFVDSIASGIQGIATKPIEGAERGGAGGFFKGIGKGVVGVLTKPAVGTFDLLSNVSGGLRNATTVFDAARAGRIRLPRHISHDGVLRPHSSRESQGLAWLKTIDNGKYRGPEYRYVAHVELPNDEDHICILTTRFLLLVRINRLATLWQVSLEDLKSISLEANGIMMTLRGDKPGPFIALSDGSLRIWFFSHIKSVVSEYNDRRNQAVGAADR